MKIIKRTSVLAILLVGFIMPTIQSCKKYPDGPLISFRSRTERVSQTWKVDNYQLNGTDLTSLMSGYTETYTKEGNYSYSWGAINGTGTWAFQNSDANIQLTGITNQGTYTLVILKLEQTEFWYYYMDGSNKKEFHMIQN
jgi:hypothetical protein